MKNNQKITLGITGLHEILSWNYGIKGPYWGPSTECVFYLILSNNVIQKQPELDFSKRNWICRKQGLQIGQIWRILCQNCADDTTEVME